MRSTGCRTVSPCTSSTLSFEFKVLFGNDDLDDSGDRGRLREYRLEQTFRGGDVQNHLMIVVMRVVVVVVVVVTMVVVSSLDICFRRAHVLPRDVKPM